MRQFGSGVDGIEIFLLHILLRVDPGGEFTADKAGAVSGGLCPGKSVDRADRRVAVPRIAAENLIGAFARKRDGDMLLDLAAEEQKGGIHIRHAGKIARLHRVE